MAAAIPYLYVHLDPGYQIEFKDRSVSSDDTPGYQVICIKTSGTDVSLILPPNSIFQFIDYLYDAISGLTGDRQAGTGQTPCDAGVSKIETAGSEG